MEGGLVLSVLLDPYSAEYKEEQEVIILLYISNIFSLAELPL